MAAQPNDNDATALPCVGDVSVQPSVVDIQIDAGVQGVTEKSTNLGGTTLT